MKGEHKKVGDFTNRDVISAHARKVRELGTKKSLEEAFRIPLNKPKIRT